MYFKFGLGFQSFFFLQMWVDTVKGHRNIFNQSNEPLAYCFLCFSCRDSDILCVCRTGIFIINKAWNQDFLWHFDIGDSSVRKASG